MMQLFQAIGIVFIVMILVAITLVGMYLAYIVGIGLLLFGLVYLIKYVLNAIHDSR